VAVRFTRVVAALITDERGRYLICQRNRRRPMPLKWEFPGGKIDAGETALQALARELREELGIEAVVAQPAARLRHSYRDGTRVALLFYRVRQWRGEVSNLVFEEVRWVPAQQLPKYDFLEADLVLVHQLAPPTSQTRATVRSRRA